MGESSVAERGSFVVVANRLPVDNIPEEEGGGWRRSPGGLVTALLNSLFQQGF